MPVSESSGLSFAELLNGLCNAKAYGHQVGEVQLIQTHASVVFLAGNFAYKIKKRIKLDFLDYSTLELRHHYCEKEMRLNRRLADDVYLGVVPIVQTEQGLRIEGSKKVFNGVESMCGELVEYAVKMRRLDESDTLKSMLKRGEIEASEIEELADKVAKFHRNAATDPDMGKWGEFESIEKNLLDNLAEMAPLVGLVLAPETLKRVQKLTRQWLEHNKSTIRSRAFAGIPRDGHGDLRLEHVYRKHNGINSSWQIVDCIEFSEGFRYGDPLIDIAFLLMELEFNGYNSVAEIFLNRYFAQSPSITNEDSGARELLTLYLAYRALVRAKVDGIKASDAAVEEHERNNAKSRAQGLALFALQKMESCERCPCMILLGGLPGTGKSTLARELVRQFGFEWIRADEIRKELLGVAATQSAYASWGEGAYSPEWNEKTYAECLSRARQSLFSGRRVVVDASFRSLAMRCRFADTAQKLSLPVEFWICHASEEVVRSRLAGRRQDASDADWRVYQRARESWEAHPEASSVRQRKLNTDDGIEAALQQVHAYLEQSGLV